MSFKAQHQLTFTDGTQEPLHEHDWNIRAAVSSERLDKNELVVDFEELKAQIEAMVKDVRGQRLESLGIFENRNVSAETLARVFYDQLDPKLPREVHLEWVEITEAPGCRARYRRSHRKEI
jgi:6-pyruvoyl-tetrahydropterin synthase